MRFWFRRPAFESGLVEAGKLRVTFPELQFTKYGEGIVDIRDVEDVDTVLKTLRDCSNPARSV